ncbi:MAG TPA: hypothetical protein VJX67_26965 [Blastocatellia bacterium]|nr:hypothetical protein [Blastocatellia bacterium]
MYCPSCGGESSAGLKFCKRCGANLAGTQNLENTVVNRVSVTGPVWALSVLGIAMFLALLGLVLGLAAMGFQALLVPITAVSAAAIVAVFGMAIRLVHRVVDQRLIDPPRQTPKQRMPAAYSPAQIAPPPSYVPSVTEDTTRVFDEPGHSGPGAKG